MRVYKYFKSLLNKDVIFVFEVGVQILENRLAKDRERRLRPIDNAAGARADGRTGRRFRGKRAGARANFLPLHRTARLPTAL